MQEESPAAIQTGAQCVPQPASNSTIPWWWAWCWFLGVGFLAARLADGGRFFAVGALLSGSEPATSA